MSRRFALLACLVAAVLAIVAPATSGEPATALSVPLAVLPPGAGVSLVPSDEIFPAQSIPLRFDHKKHVQGLKLTCKVCHEAAWSSDDAKDRLVPKPETCDACHDVDHAAAGGPRVIDAGARGQCATCHTATLPGGRVAPLVMPRANLRFSHRKHLLRNIQCGQCHGQVGALGLATRDQLPRMAGCFACHAMDGPGRGDAKGDCPTCHLTEPDGRLSTTFAAGSLVPPRWMRGAAHDADWIERHKSVAADDSAFCGRCHTASECTDCHDGRVRPRKVHPNDWLGMHAQASRTDNPRCTSCHAEQTFCGDCHKRTGVARDAPSGDRPSGRRFHPPPDVWTNAPRGPMHHAWEAMRNLNACVSCHTERDCATCHATKGLSGGEGVDPHPAGFQDKCGLALRQNPRPCLVCHQPSDGALRSCR